MKKECAECDQITVFMVCHGQATAEKRRVSIPKTTTLRAMKGLFGRPIAQEVIADENWFMFSEEDLEKPVCAFSNGCLLSISFFFESHFKETKRKVETVTGLKPKL